MIIRVALACALLFASTEARANDEIINLFGNILSEVLEAQDGQKHSEGIDWNDAKNQPSASRDGTHESQSKRNTIQVQTALKSLGYYNGAIDGISGAGTISAIKKWQSANGFTSDGQLSNEQLEKLVSSPAPVTVARDLCLSSLCIGMTVDQALAQGVHFKDGRIARNEDQAAMRSMLENQYGARNVQRELNRLGGMPSYEGNPDSEKMQSVKNLSLDELAYLSTFYPDQGHLASLDERALAYMAKAKICTYFQVSATAEMADGRSTDIRFLPLGENYELVIVRLMRDYKYLGVERNLFEKNVLSQYGEFHLSYDFSATDRPDVVLSLGDRHQKLVLLHPDWWNFAGFATEGIYANAQKRISTALQSQDGCYRKDAPI